MNAIIIAAGSGKRISEDAKDLPKSLLMVNGKPIIVHQIQALKQVGIENIIVITGAHGEKFEIVEMNIPTTKKRERSFGLAKFELFQK